MKYILEAHEAHSMIKELQKIIMKRCKLRNKILKSKTFSDSKAHTSQPTFWKWLLRNARKRISRI